jgi:hypothetical protein
MASCFGGGSGLFRADVGCSMDGIISLGRSCTDEETIIRAAIGSNLSDVNRLAKCESLGSSGKSSAIRFSSLSI